MNIIRWRHLVKLTRGAVGVIKPNDEYYGGADNQRLIVSLAER